MEPTRAILVTGANRGIGKAIVEAILEQTSDTLVYLGSRDRKRGETAVMDIQARKSHWKDRAVMLPLDVGSDSSVDSAAKIVRQNINPDLTFYGIVNNAGVGYPDSELKPTLEINVRGIKRVVEAFAPLMPSEGGRIVNLTSAAGPNFVAKCSSEYQYRLTSDATSLESLENLMAEAEGMPSRQALEKAGLGDGSAYGFSKACANTLTLIQARMLPQHLVNACTPGFIETELTRPIAVARGMTPEEMGMKSVEHGTVAPLKLLCDPIKSSGWYYGSDGLRSPLHEYRAPGAPEYSP
jgi:NAD(P)-dependent dehydrogenase (short-subunit alcohol dehydrogenase family)